MIGKLRVTILGAAVAASAFGVAGSKCYAQGVGATIDVSGVPQSVANSVLGLVGYLGIQPTGTVKENDETWCVFNDWAARDQRARIEGTYDNGRFSVGTTFGGRWYCCMKRGK